MRVLTVEKGDFSRHRFYESPPGFVFHFGNARETPEGQIRFDYVRSEPGARMMTGTLRALMRGDVANLSVEGTICHRCCAAMPAVPSPLRWADERI